MRFKGLEGIVPSTVDDADHTEAEIPAVAKKRMSRRAKIVIVTYMSIAISLIVILVFIMSMFSHNEGPPTVPTINTHKGTNATATTWTVRPYPVAHRC